MEQVNDPVCIDTEVLEAMDVVYDKTPLLTDAPMHYCPGCGHGIAHKMLMEVIAEMGIQEQTIGVAPVGCSVFAYHYMDVDMQEAAHGRACAVATGIKRVRPDKYVFTYQGDGDLAAIGTAETIHAVNRGENILVLFINNAIYGMTGGQMAPTSLQDQVTSTSPYGRDTKFTGAPLKMTELVAQLPGAYFVTRQAVNNVNSVRRLKKAIRTALEYQKENNGTCFIEVISNCPSGYRMTPLQSMRWIEENMFNVFPLGDIKVPAKQGAVS